ncbi:MAG: hypothetical protein H7144_12485 [Burkholderiales bacterium]|nr:hypothetical protein [Phycisphaerae bacterium]
MKPRRIIALLTAIAVLARVAATLYADAATLPGGEDRAIAQNLSQRLGFSFAAFSYHGPTSSRAPVYPMLLAGIDAIAGSDKAATFAALVINALAGGASVILAYAVARRLFASKIAPWLMAVFFAIWPTQVYPAIYQQPLSLAVMLLLGVLYFAASRKPHQAVPAGLLAGAAVLSESILLIPLVLLIALIAARRPVYALTVLLAAMCLVTPWIYRNAIVHRQPSAITNNVWPDVFSGNGPDATGSLHLIAKDPDGRPLARLDRLSPIESDQLKRQPESVRNAQFRKWSLQWIGDNPLAYAKLCAIRVAKLLWLDWDHPLALHWLNLASRSVLFAGFIFALVHRHPRATDLPGMVSAFASGRVLGIMLAIGLVLASAFTISEARSAVFVDVAQLLAVASLADRKREQ